jgi:hypothetical protein
MSGWVTVAAIGLVLLAVAVLAIRIGARRWWDYPIIAVLTVLLFPFLERTITGDVSRYTPPGAFSEGGAGKDQIIIASVLATILGGVILAACMLWAAHGCWRRLRR